MKNGLLIISVLVLTTYAFAEIIHVPADQPTIQAGLMAATEGDTVLVAPNTYTENIFWPPTNGIKLMSENGPGNTIIDGSNTSTVIYMYGGTIDTTTVIDGFTLQNGTADAGGGIICVNVSLKLENLVIANNEGGGCDFTNSSAVVRDSEISNNNGIGIKCKENSNITVTGSIVENNNGTGIYFDSSTGNVSDCEITDNSAEEYGGGIYCYNYSSPTLTNVMISGNSASDGGGIYCYSSSPSLVDVTLSNNSASSYGGGIYCWESSPSLVDVTISDNSASYYGGGIYSKYSSPSLENVTISNNSASSKGGGMYCYNLSNPTLSNVTITGNSASNGGGGMYCSESNPTLSNVTITGNSAASGGGIFCLVSSPSLENVTISDNSASDDGGGIYCSYSNPSLENVTISDNSASDDGGGIYCHFNSSPSLANVTISGNSAEYSGGGIFCYYNSSPSFSSENRCNIYSNNTTGRGSGADIFADECPVIDVIVDTFTVMTPTDYYASPLDNFTFDILNAVNPQQVDADLYVSPDGDNSNDGLTAESPLKTIQYATSIILADSTNPHTIHLANGIYSPSTNGEYFPVEVINYVSLVGESEDGVILDAEGVAGVMKCISVTSSTISHLTLTNGSASSGGGIYCYYNSSPSLVDVTITDNSASDDGGGIYCDYYSSPSLENVTISNNSASDDGGGIFCLVSSPSLENVTISDNSASDDGGGIYCRSSSPTLENVTLSGNSADDSGGGIYYIYCWYESNPSLENVTITNNSAGYDGGGIYCWESSPSLVDVTISDNSASYYGGGIYYIYCWYESNPSLANVTITNNSAGYYGGGIYCDESSPSLANVTITGNSASYGGGIFCYSSSPSLVNCILWNDSPQEVYVSSGSVNIFYSDIQGGWTGEGNINLDPLFVDAATGDYHLTANSPCIDAGISFFVFEGDTLVDMSEDEYVGSAPDMGAFEYGASGGVDDDFSDVPEDFSLFQNYPNPFNPVTTISYQLPKTGVVRLSIYNIKGQLVETLVNEQRSPGSYSATWYANDVSSGLYFYKLTTGNKIVTKKMLLLK